MREGSMIVRDGRIRFISRKDSDARGSAFWLYVRLHSEVRDHMRERFFTDLVEDLCKQWISVEGGDFEGWDWQLLVTSDSASTDLTADDQAKVEHWLQTRTEVEIFELGDLVDAAPEYGNLDDERRRQEEILNYRKDEWGQAYKKVNGLIQAEEFPAAIRSADKWIADMEADPASAAAFFLPRAYGLLAVARFHSGHREDALDAFTKARDLCVTTGDTAGAENYQANIDHLRT